MVGSPDNPVFFPTQDEFRAWLQEHHASEGPLWVGYYRKSSGRASITWAETVDEALCFGWIDGVRKSRDETSYVIRFTPRRPTSVWSARNFERVEALRAAGCMRPPGLAAYAHRNKHPQSGYTVGDRPTEFPAEIARRFQAHLSAWDFYNAQPPGYRKQTVFWVTSARREATRERRLAQLIEDSVNGLRIQQLRK